MGVPSFIYLFIYLRGGGREGGAYMAYDSFLRKIETEWAFPLFYVFFSYIR